MPKWRRRALSHRPHANIASQATPIVVLQSSPVTCVIGACRCTNEVHDDTFSRAPEVIVFAHEKHKIQCLEDPFHFANFQRAHKGRKHIHHAMNLFRMVRSKWAMVKSCDTFKSCILYISLGVLSSRQTIRLFRLIWIDLECSLNMFEHDQSDGLHNLQTQPRWPGDSCQRGNAPPRRIESHHVVRQKTNLPLPRKPFRNTW